MKNVLGGSNEGPPPKDLIQEMVGQPNPPTVSASSLLHKGLK